MWPKDNPESWQHIYEFIQEFPDDEYWSLWKPMAQTIISDLEKLGLSPLFRIGQSMHQIILSTTERHGLTTEPRVTLEFYPEEQRVRVAYSYQNLYFGEPAIDERVEPEKAMEHTLRLLSRLWNETKPGARIPDALNPG